MGKCSKDKRVRFGLDLTAISIESRAKEQGFRARSAFKLIQLDDTFELLNGVSRVVDLCAAPGGWSQVIAERLRMSHTSDEEFAIVAVDLMEMAPIDGVIQLKGDITHKKTADEIIAHFHGRKAHVVVSDGAPDVLGLHDLDEFLQAQLVLVGLNISLHVLEPGGTFVAKIFRGKEVSLLYAQLRRFFGNVTCAKPKASRNSSFESFVVCQDFQLPDGFVPNMDEHLLDLQYENEEEDDDVAPKDMQFHSGVDSTRGVRDDVHFRGCGDVFGDDSDQSYPLSSEGYVHQEPLQKPINPPYANALKKKKTE
ncbi:TPA: hypothetical protein N0F65_011076 [Lagenidium giganteum]|uniref:Ribosomal RNA methyltransferase FtsJ domain-containing protein n=1 Tax=Lagenidium giganteum TaxID=4803 RepID=A0AAV2ZAU1_9STRA|nr:TPA: hypothetical protein N0F65_011076 [Lagenidium giganteum]